MKYTKTNTLGVENSPNRPYRGIANVKGRRGTIYLSHISKTDSGMQSLLEHKIEFETQNSRATKPSRSINLIPSTNVGPFVAGLLLKESKRLLQLDSMKKQIMKNKTIMRIVDTINSSQIV